MIQRLSLSMVIMLAAAVPGQAVEPEVGAQSRGSYYASRPEPGSPSYRLGPTDRIRLKVYGEGDITGDYEVDSAGYVSVPLAGRVKAAGLTTRQLENAIAAALSQGMLKDPRVNVEVANYRPFFILGEVKRAGEYPYKAGLTVLDAVASAGGYTYRANEGKVVIRRAGSVVEEIYPLDAPVMVFPGDNIRVPERWF
ncbi:polysaccharide biosynthesis/export family protein [Bradyrhizobium sp. LHD-71]|uniref:polysaccharide biosynthesis/export family protein n=1 Tax=Bradyrhizobium sp. LHD-71 TaxID=3072141 RepID=UPI00280DDC8A|nr:polysaccharide biosynthesis/export family protein [Bradyrhizobium sp. LHD-71]MDQ8729775.1 polysaccharide biosynthesis/export family protein [Bradyrhizobium sp. LHD-71]